MSYFCPSPISAHSQAAFIPVPFHVKIRVLMMDKIPLLCPPPPQAAPAHPPSHMGLPANLPTIRLGPSAWNKLT